MDAIRSLLTDCKLEAVAHKNSEMLKTVSEKSTVGDTVKMMKEANILSVPVLGPGSKQFSGCFSITDVLKSLVSALRLENKRNSFDMGSDDAAAALKRIYEGPVSKVMHAGDLWYLQGQDPTVMDAVKDMLQRRAVHHRLFTCETMKETSPTGILSQSDIVRLIWDHRSELGDVREKTVEDMGLCAGAAETVPASEITTQVLVDMWRDRKTCMGITAPNGDLIGNVSISDLRAVTPELFPLLKGPIGAFVLAVRGYSAPEGKDVDWSSALRAVPVHIVTPDTKFEKVLEALSVHKLHRVYVIDKTEKATGIITLTDILRQVLPKVEEMPSEGPAMGLPHSSEVPEEQEDAAMQTEENGAANNGAA